MLDNLLESKIWLPLQPQFRRESWVVKYMVDVAQLVRALDCGSRCRRFESDLPPVNGGEYESVHRFFALKIAVRACDRMSVVAFLVCILPLSGQNKKSKNTYDYEHRQNDH